MINVASTRVYEAALRQLHAYKTQNGTLGRFVQLFLGLKFYGNQLPSMFSGQYVSTAVLQTMLDDLYTKASRPADDCVLMLFEENYLARTGITAPGHAVAQNTWRNNFNLQKGVGCYAPAQDLSSPTFLNQQRGQCRYLQPGPTGGLSHGRCRMPTRLRSSRRNVPSIPIRLAAACTGSVLLHFSIASSTSSGSTQWKLRALPGRTMPRRSRTPAHFKICRSWLVS